MDEGESERYGEEEEVGREFHFFVFPMSVFVRVVDAELEGA